LVTWQRVANYSLLYIVQGSKAHLKPYLLMGHLDVVPADDVDEWEAPPFSASILDDYIYGRGTIDDKHTVMVSEKSQDAF
jgi:carboxypeptidase PM20D1